MGRECVHDRVSRYFLPSKSLVTAAFPNSCLYIVAPKFAFYLLNRFL